MELALAFFTIAAYGVIKIRSNARRNRVFLAK